MGRTSRRSHKEAVKELRINQIANIYDSTAEHGPGSDQAQAAWTLLLATQHVLVLRLRGEGKHGRATVKDVGKGFQHQNCSCGGRRVAPAGKIAERSGEAGARNEKDDGKRTCGACGHAQKRIANGKMSSAFGHLASCPVHNSQPMTGPNGKGPREGGEADGRAQEHARRNGSTHRDTARGTAEQGAN